MPTTTPQYRLVIFDAIDDPIELRDLVCRVTGMHPTDAVQWLARAPGTWPQPLEETTVRELLDGFYEAGVAAEAWRTDLFPDLSPPRTIHRAACMKEGFRIEGLRAEPTHWVPVGPDRADLRGPDLHRGRVSQCPGPSVAVDGRVGNPRPGSDEAPTNQPPRPGDPDSTRSGRRGDHRPPRPADRVSCRRKPDELRLPGRAPEPRRPRTISRCFSPISAPGPTRLISPTPPAHCWNTANPASTNSPVLRRFSTTRPTDCSGVGTAAIATLSRRPPGPDTTARPRRRRPSRHR